METSLRVPKRKLAKARHDAAVAVNGPKCNLILLGGNPSAAVAGFHMLLHRPSSNPLTGQIFSFSLCIPIKRNTPFRQ